MSLATSPAAWMTPSSLSGRFLDLKEGEGLRKSDTA